LRDRREDIPALAAHFLKLYAMRYRKAVSTFEPAALQALIAYTWPGNVRELAHAVERAALLAEGDKVRVSDLALRAPDAGGGRQEHRIREEVERLLLEKAAARSQGTSPAAAKALGLSRSALYRRLQHHGL